MKKVAIVIGHGPKIDKGSENHDGTTELAWNTDLANRIAKCLSGRLDFTIVHRVTETLQPVKETNETNADAAIELHLNAFNGIASGTEMIVHEKSDRGNRLGNLLLAAAVNVLRLPNRGVKGPQGGGRGQRWLQGTRMPAVIVESFFVDNDNDLRIGNDRKDALAQAYADALVKFLD